MWRGAGRPAQITIERMRSAGFTYHLQVDNEEIERDIGISAAGLAGELGTHFVRPSVDEDGFGMTLANCGQRQDGVVARAAAASNPRVASVELLVELSS